MTRYEALVLEQVELEMRLPSAGPAEEERICDQLAAIAVEFERLNEGQ